ncbi:MULTISPECIES: porin family protein [unclassified Pasteurella]|uniref:porin family protein n=1 Tax=unclassified Pasteurella TaxID=2621516 RepID=UPI001073D41D|nr:DUF560 domain-containing protein [Pasteurella sp. 19428wF3_WM03]TFU52855.1 DUF560 domain-containing protein [Pasteurella sp. WM03]
MKKFSFALLFLFISRFSAAQSFYFEKGMNFKQVEQVLSENLYQLNAQDLNILLENYRNFSEHNARLAGVAAGRVAFLQKDYSQAITLYRKVLAENPTLTPVRLELAITLFYQKQNEAAKEQFEKIKSDPELPEDSRRLVEHYLENLAKQAGWEIDFSIHYVKEKNVNNVSDAENIRLSNQATLSKSGGMLPQKAQGFSYYLNVNRDFNLVGSHYFSLTNLFVGKSYWDNHKYDDIFNRTSLGYAYKVANNTFRIKPFYEKRWYGNKSYRWNNGISLENAYWFSPNWRLSLSFEFAKQHYFDELMLNGHSRLFSSTLAWFINPKLHFYLGTDVVSERTKVRQYSSDSHAFRAGWGQEWQGGISSQIGLSFIKRAYKDTAKLGNLDFFSFGKVRKDHIYSLHMLLWKRDWHLWGITPKLQFIWKKQNSNIPQMYSYKQSNINLVFEKRF